MTGARPALERFDGPDRPAARPIVRQAPPRSVPDPAGAAPVLSCGGQEPQGAPAPAATPDNPQSAAAQHLAAIADAVSRVVRDAAALRRATETALAEAFARAAAAALPSLAQEGFAAEVAAASLEIARAAEMADLELRLSPEDEPAVRAALEAAPPSAGAIRITRDPALAPGRAELGWAHGGARFDAAALADAALGCLHRQLAIAKPEDTAP
jgi:flagellar biosynthesis/type III secretory pathway protein FliH